jgi:hypothetical protein
LFAGTGLNWSLTREQEIDGSPVIVLKAGDPKAIEVIVAENDSRAFPVLRSRLTPYGARAVPFEADANEVIDQMLARVPVRAPAFAFLDPEGSELDWRTVVSIADHKRGHSPYKIEQLILFPTDMGFVRLAPDHPEKVTRIFGHDEWRAIYDKRRRGAIDADSGFEARRSPLESPANRAYRSFSEVGGPGPRNLFASNGPGSTPFRGVLFASKSAPTTRRSRHSQRTRPWSTTGWGASSTRWSRISGSTPRTSSADQ